MLQSSCSIMLLSIENSTMIQLYQGNNNICFLFAVRSFITSTSAYHSNGITVTMHLLKASTSTLMGLSGVWSVTYMN